MCCLFGIIDHASTFSAKEKNRIVKVLSTEAEERGTDATGIAFNTNSGLHIFKRPVAAHLLWYRIPESAKIIMGHTRMATQSSEYLNYTRLYCKMTHSAICFLQLAIMCKKRLF